MMLIHEKNERKARNTLVKQPRESQCVVSGDFKQQIVELLVNICENCPARRSDQKRNETNSREKQITTNIELIEKFTKPVKKAYHAQITAEKFHRSIVKGDSEVNLYSILNIYFD